MNSFKQNNLKNLKTEIDVTFIYQMEDYERYLKNENMSYRIFRNFFYSLKDYWAFLLA